MAGNVRVCVLLLAAAFTAFLGQVIPTHAEPLQQAVVDTHQISYWIHDLSAAADPDGVYIHHENAKVAVSGQYVHVVWWAQNWSPDPGNLYYMRSTDGGNTFEEARKIVTGPAPGNTDYQYFNAVWNSLVADGPYVHLVYVDQSKSPPQLMYQRSVDNGENFTPVVLMADNNVTVFKGVYVAAPAGKVIVAFVGEKYNSAPNTKALYCFYSSDAGATYKTTTVFSCNDSNGCWWEHRVVDAAMAGDNVYLLLVSTERRYAYEGHKALMLYASGDGGATFKPGLAVNEKTKNGQYWAPTIQDADYSPNLAASGNEVNIVWMNNEDTNFEGYNEYTLRTRRSTDAGTTLEDSVILHQFPAGDSTVGYHPGLETIARSGDNVFIVTRKDDAPDPGGTYLWRSTDGGATWGAKQQVSPGGWWPQLLLDLPGVHIYNGWYFQSSDSGATFDGGVDPGMIYEQRWGPSAAMGSDGTVYLAYQSTYGGRNDWLLYRRLQPAEPAPGATNKGMLFTTVVDYANIANMQIDNMQVVAGPDVNVSSAMTLEFWVKLVSGDAPYATYLIHKPTANNKTSYEIAADYYSGVLSSFVRTDQTSAWANSGVALTKGAWTHVAVTYDANAGSDNHRIYINGVLSGKATGTGNIVTDTKYCPLVVRGNNPGRTNNPGQLQMDELRLWNRALAGSEIRTGMSGPLTGSEPGLAAYYNFNDTVKDITGHGNDGLLMYKERYDAMPEPPVADFSASPLSGTAPLVVTFTNTSQDDIGIRTWDFGDGSTGAEQSPVHTYSQPGIYTVSLTLIGPGTSGVKTRASYITVSPPVGSLKVTITPDAANTAGAQWKVDTGDWQAGGATVANLTVGSHKLTFKDVTGWTTPAPQNVTIEKDKTASATGAYVQHVGSLKVTITPAAAMTAGAQWNVDAGDWQAGGSTVANLPIGSHTVTFKELTGWSTPAAQTVTIENGKTTAATGAYVQQVGYLLVTIFPAAAITAGAQWRIDNGSWLKSCVRVPNIAVGSHTVSFKNLPGWTSPPPQTVTVNTARTTAATGNYTPLPLVPDFVGTPASGKAPLKVTFTDKSTGPITYRVWNFGDGGSSTAKNPSHVYQTVGTYTVTLTIAGAGGTKSATKLKYIKVVR